MSIRTSIEEQEFLSKLGSWEIRFPFVNLYKKLSALNRFANYKSNQSLFSKKDKAIIQALRVLAPQSFSFIYLIIQEELLPYLIRKIKVAPIHSNPLECNQLVEILFGLPSSII